MRRARRNKPSATEAQTWCVVEYSHANREANSGFCLRDIVSGDPASAVDACKAAGPANGGDSPWGGYLPVFAALVVGKCRVMPARGKNKVNAYNVWLHRRDGTQGKEYETSVSLVRPDSNDTETRAGDGWTSVLLAEKWTAE
jgi:hypothetical protein